MRKFLAILGVLGLAASPFVIKGTICSPVENTAVETEVEQQATIDLSEVVPEVVVVEPEPTEPPRDYAPVTLKRNFGYYQGKLPMQEVTKIIFTNVAPEEYDESWYANEADTEDIMGYLQDTTVYIVGDEIFANGSSKWMFSGTNTYGEELWSSLKAIEGLDYLNTSRVYRMSYMFLNNKYITELDLSSWDVSKVDDMTMMFCGCLNLETLEVSNWDTSNCGQFAAMFQGNDNKGDMKLKNIDVSNWDTSKALNMSHMFYGCAQLESLDLSKWNVETVGSFSHMFADCYNLKEIDISGWDTLGVASFDAMFNDCRSLVSIDISNLETSTCFQFSQMFESCYKLETIIGIEDVDVSGAEYYAFSEMFHQCHSLKSLDLSKWEAPNADNYARMFAGCKRLEFLDISGLSDEDIVTVTEMFKGCYNLKEVVGLENLDLSNANGYSQMLSESSLNGKY